MRCIRDCAGLFSAIALVWHVVAVAAVSTALCCRQDPGSEHAGMENCPMQHSSAPACPVHADKHGSHECDCPTLGCSEADASFLALFGAVGVLPDAAELAVPFDVADAEGVVAASALGLVSSPLSPPPRS